MARFTIEEIETRLFGSVSDTKSSAPLPPELRNFIQTTWGATRLRTSVSRQLTIALHSEIWKIIDIWGKSQRARTLSRALANLAARLRDRKDQRVRKITWYKPDGYTESHRILITLARLDWQVLEGATVLVGAPGLEEALSGFVRAALQLASETEEQRAWRLDEADERARENPFREREWWFSYEIDVEGRDPECPEETEG